MTAKKKADPTPTQTPRVLFDPVTSEWVVAHSYIIYMDETSARAGAGG